MFRKKSKTTRLENTRLKDKKLKKTQVCKNKFQKTNVKRRRSNKERRRKKERLNTFFWMRRFVPVWNNLSFLGFQRTIFRKRFCSEEYFFKRGFKKGSNTFVCEERTKEGPPKRNIYWKFFLVMTKS